MRKFFFQLSALVLLTTGLFASFYPPFLLTLCVTGPIMVLGVMDTLQRRHTIRRNFPVIGHFRYLFEAIRPEINQYFVESNSDGVPFSREQRSLVYQRAKKELDTLPFGTQMNVYEIGYEWANHSLVPKHVDTTKMRVHFGGKECKQPYSGSVFNVSAMSYGSLSKNAVLALNGGAKIGGFAHNTGEGGLTPYHLGPGGDLIWQVGTGYFSCRDAEGKFCPSRFQERSQLPNVKMIELKLSQGAKPSHGGILPAAKVTAEIAAIRGVEVGKTVLSPPAHSTFSTPIGLLEFVAKLRELSGGKPVGFKLCIGKRREFMAIAKAMKETGILPDFITVDGGEGGTGAAPLEFSNSLGFPLKDALVFVHSVLTGMDLRSQIRLVAAGKNLSGFDLVSRFALGADACGSARAMMMALGCIQALRCNSNACPTGVATQDPELVAGLDVGRKTQRVANFHMETVRSAAEIIGAMGLGHPSEVRPWHLQRRVTLTGSKHYGELYPFLKPGDLLRSDLPDEYARAYRAATHESFGAVSTEPV